MTDSSLISNKDIADRLKAKRPGYKKNELICLVDDIVEIMQQGVVEGNKVRLVNFATFELKKMPSRKITTLKNIKYVETKGSYYMSVRASKTIKKKIRSRHGKNF